jgi:hypothetical protein
MPTRRGRPHEGPELADEVDDCSEEARQRLRQENERLTFELKAQQLREEIGLLMPHLLKPRADRPVKKKKK